MLIRVICLGKTDQGFIEEGVSLYRKRLQHYVKMEWVELDNRKALKHKSVEDVKKQEWALLSTYVEEPNFSLWICDEKGKEYDSLGFASSLERTFSQGGKGLNICIGGPFGLSEKALEKANLKLSLSRMTFTHQMVRLVLAEQLYRGMKINSNESYHN